MAVIAGDIHYNLQNLILADIGTRMAIAKANELNVPFIANGDTHDSKANLRAECVNSMIETFKTAKIKPYVNIGNHCKINQKSKEHALNFLRPYAHIIDTAIFSTELNSYVIPYEDEVEVLRAYLRTIPMGSRLIMHQGLLTGKFGEYINDKSALNTEDLRDFRTILSHYHARQDIKCGRPKTGAVGLASYVGSLFTTTFAESEDPYKGYQILMDDGTLEFVPTNLRKHIIIDIDLSHVLVQMDTFKYAHGDLVWVKIRGTKEQLHLWDKERTSKELCIKDFRLDLIPTDTDTRYLKKIEKMSQNEILDDLIDSKNDLSEDKKQELKTLWKKF